MRGLGWRQGITWTKWVMHSGKPGFALLSGTVFGLKGVLDRHGLASVILTVVLSEFLIAVLLITRVLPGLLQELL